MNCLHIGRQAYGFTLGTVQPPCCFLTLSIQTPVVFSMHSPRPWVLHAQWWVRQCSDSDLATHSEVLTREDLTHSACLTNTYQNILPRKAIPLHHGKVQMGACSITSTQYFPKFLKLIQYDDLCCSKSPSTVPNSWFNSEVTDSGQWPLVLPAQSE